MEAVPPPPRPAGDEVVIRGTRRPLSPAVAGLVIVPFALIAWIGVQASPLFGVVGGVGLAVAGFVLVRTGIVNLGWLPPELTLPAGPLLLGSRNELTFRRRPRHPMGAAAGQLEVALVCEERVVVGSDDHRTTRTATVVRHLIQAPVVISPSGVEARFTVEIPMVAGGPTLRMGSAKNVVWRVEARLDGEGLPGEPIWFPLEVAPVISPAWFDRRSPA